MKDSFLKILVSEGKKPYFEKLLNFLKQDQFNNIVPFQTDMFRAFDFFQMHETKVLLLGQDPYYKLGVADGLAFSTKSKLTPQSLQNIFKELKNEYPNIKLQTNDLSGWAKQKVLLLNIYLTTLAGKALAHRHIGWDQFTKVVCELILQINPNVIVIALGKEVQNFVNSFSIKPKYYLKTSHPSPFSANKGFLGSNIFKKTNIILNSLNETEINWELKQGE
ncbi:uracil-DNA glycosylase [Mycoplasmopsis cricetuli]|uniref:uracil-DNA glycosylase n=1 Tax=Mycoplasmopsis cricetuli TaxID=171283 RepID=UPI0004704661|nr:uracil-DNA glycosylase [Mycoplasmopsis cricetuli]